MKTILVVDDDRMILRLAREALKEEALGYAVRTAQNGEEALKIIQSEPVDLVMTDLKMPGMDGFALLSHMNGRHRDIPVIVMTGYGSPEISRRLQRKGVFDTIEKPFEIDALRGKIAEAFNGDSKGFIHGFTLPNFLQAVQVEEKTITLRVGSQGRVGYLHIHEGDLIDADVQTRKGLTAAHEILQWSDPEIEMQGLRSRKRTIRMPLMRLLLESSQRRDESCGFPGEEDPLQRGIFMAEAHHFKAAHKLLTEVLKKTPRRADAWFWYSRIVVNPKSIEAALGNAAKLTRDAPHVKEEQDRFRKAKPALEGEAVRRCPFCWAPISTRFVECGICRSHLSVQPALFASPLTADKKVMERAIERYTRVVARERNTTAYYYLSMAHLNAGRWEEALHLFHKLVNLAPERKVFSYQLRRLLDHMASRESDGTAQAETPAPEAPPADAEGRRKRILVVEDSPTTRKVIAITLGQQGYEVIEAKDGLEALGKLNDRSPHLILLDIVLPRMDGYAILDIIRKQEQFRNVPVILLTSKDGVLSKWKGRWAGSTAYLTKPFDPKKLVATIEKHL